MTKSRQKKRQPQYNPTAITILLQDISDHVIKEEDWKRIETINYYDDASLHGVFLEFSRAAYQKTSDTDRKEAKLALREAIEESNYNYDLIWGMMAFPFIFSDDINDPQRFLKLLWRALFDQDFQATI